MANSTLAPPIRYDTDMVPPKATPLADWIYRFRLHRDQTQEDFAHSLNLSLSAVQNWEYGRKVPTGATRLFLAMLAEESDFEPPPKVSSKRGPRRDTKTG